MMKNLAYLCCPNCSEKVGIINKNQVVLGPRNDPLCFIGILYEEAANVERVHRN